MYGENNEEILGSILGIKQREINEMWEEKIIGNIL